MLFRSWAVLHRPDAGGIENIWSAFSPDLLHWGEPHCVLPERSGAAWDSVKVGAGPPPILTEHGWLLLYHGVATRHGGGNFYQMGAALLDPENPARLLARTRENLLEPREPYELVGQVANVVFPSGMIVEHFDDEGFATTESLVRVYYGAADTVVGLATTTIARLIESCTTA